ncbi:MAG TPA: hypothetical protein VJ249_08245 [Candidatus Bathyarchaeia archaeon]|nr:hypothetical protein [Candidatus Bathyarchaeia archaeon]
MLRNKTTIRKFLIGPIILGFLLTFASALYRSEFVFPQRAEPCIYSIFKVPLKQTSYGLPTPWLTTIEGVYKYGCGPIVSHYTEYQLIWQGILTDTAVYALICASLLYLKDRIKRTAKTTTSEPIHPNIQELLL